jgi:hypothetical protein
VEVLREPDVVVIVVAWVLAVVDDEHDVNPNDMTNKHEDATKIIPFLMLSLLNY